MCVCVCVCVHTCVACVCLCSSLVSVFELTCTCICLCKVVHVCGTFEFMGEHGVHVWDQERTKIRSNNTVMEYAF